MFRHFLFALALLAPVSAAAADGPRVAAPGAVACKKVNISFGCRIRGSGKMSLPCRAGENEATCCARWKAKHTNPRSGLCAKRGGTVSYTCACPKKGGPAEPSDERAEERKGRLRGDRLHAPGPGEPGKPDMPTAPGKPGGPPAPPPPPQPDEPTEPVPPPTEPGGSTGLPGFAPSGDPGPCVRRGGGTYRRYCLRVSFSYACKGGASGRFSPKCGKGQSQAGCCRKIMAGLCGGKGPDPKRTGKIQNACRCIQWSGWQKCGPRR